MGRNAYFVTGARSAHSFLADTCTTCHMELTTPPPAFSGGGQFGTNHGFLTSLNICTNCHGSYNGGTIQDSFNIDFGPTRLGDPKGYVSLGECEGKPPTGTTIVIVYGRNVTISINGAAAVTIATYLTGAMGTTAWLPSRHRQSDMELYAGGE